MFYFCNLNNKPNTYLPFSSFIWDFLYIYRFWGSTKRDIRGLYSREITSWPVLSPIKNWFFPSLVSGKSLRWPYYKLTYFFSYLRRICQRSWRGVQSSDSQTRRDSFLRHCFPLCVGGCGCQNHSGSNSLRSLDDQASNTFESTPSSSQFCEFSELDDATRSALLGCQLLTAAMVDENSPRRSSGLSHSKCLSITIAWLKRWMGSSIRLSITLDSTAQLKHLIEPSYNNFVLSPFLFTFILVS